MELAELGALGELVGGIAVIASLLYVGLQVRESRRTSEAANNQAQADAHAAYLTQIALEPALASSFQKLFRRGEEIDALTPDEDARMVPFLHVVFTQFQIGFMSFENQLLRRGLRDHLAVALEGWLRAAYVQRWWSEQGDMYSPAFRAHVDDAIAALAPAAEL